MMTCFPNDIVEQTTNEKMKSSSFTIKSSFTHILTIIVKINDFRDLLKARF